MTGDRAERSTAADRTVVQAGLQAVLDPPVLSSEPLAAQPWERRAHAEGSTKSPGLPVGPGPAEEPWQTTWDPTNPNRACWTCGRVPTGKYRDGSPAYRCHHAAVTATAEQAARIAHLAQR